MIVPRRGPRSRSRQGRRATLLVLAAGALAACAGLPAAADRASDAPEGRVVVAGPARAAASYEEALRRWRGAEDVNAWIGARFRYDMARAMQLSETRRDRGGRVAIHAPDAFFLAPSGVCVDLARFAVETLRVIEPEARPAYVMIEFEPVSIGGNTLRRHWVVSFQRDGRRYFFADSKRPGHIAGPYGSTQEFIDEYARYRERPIVTFKEAGSYERRSRALAAKQRRQERP